MENFILKLESTFCFKARSTRDSDIIGREGPVSVAQPGVVRAPSGLVMGLPATATPASKGMQLLKCSFPLGRDTYCILYVICVSQPASCSRLSGCFMGGTRRCQQVGQRGASRRASVRCPEERSPTQIYHRRLHPAQDARERQLWQGSRGDLIQKRKSKARSRACMKMWHLCHVTLYINILTRAFKEHNSPEGQGL